MNAMRWALLVAAVAAMATGLMLWQKPPADPEAPPPVEAPREAEQSHYPVPSPEVLPEPAAALPPLDGGDAAVRAELEGTVGKGPVEAFLLPTEFLRRFVALVDSLDRHPVPLQFRPVKHVEGVPATQPQGDSFLLLDEDARRYEPWVAALQAVDSRKLAALYLRYYPLLQKAYEDLGYPGGYFNDRVVKVIDHLLAAPDIVEPIELVRPKVLYLYADPALEQRSWGQKTLIRMRPHNASVVKAKLSEIRGIIAINEQKP